MANPFAPSSVHEPAPLDGTTPVRQRRVTGLALPGSIKGDVKKKHVPLHDRRRGFLTSRPWMRCELCSGTWSGAPGPGKSESSDLRFFLPSRSACKQHGGKCQPWFYRRLEAYRFVGLSEGAYGGRRDCLPNPEKDTHPRTRALRHGKVFAEDGSAERPGAGRSRCLWLYVLGLERFSFLPNTQCNCSDFACQR